MIYISIDPKMNVVCVIFSLNHSFIHEIRYNLIGFIPCQTYFMYYSVQYLMKGNMNQVILTSLQYRN